MKTEPSSSSLTEVSASVFIASGTDLFPSATSEEAPLATASEESSLTHPGSEEVPLTDFPSEHDSAVVDSVFGSILKYCSALVSSIS